MTPVLPLAAGLHPFAGVAFDLPDDDLASLGAIIGNAELVGLGESVHTSGGFYDAKVRVFRYLVEKHGFRALAMETPWVAAERAGDYVRTCEGDPGIAATAVFGVFADIATARVFEWMCAWNLEHPDDPVVFFGFDVQQGWDDGRLLRFTLREHAPGEETEAAIAGFGRCAGASAMAKQGYAEWLDQQDGPDPERHARCIEGLDALAPIIATLPEATRSWTELHALGLRAWENEVHAFLAGDGQRSTTSRDEGMADTLLRMRALRAPGARTAIWAHNAHIAWHGERINVGRGVADPEGRSMGSFLRERLGEEAYRPIGLLAWDVDIDWGRYRDPAPSRKRRDLATVLRRQGQPFLIVDLAQAPLKAGRQYLVGSEWQVPAEQYAGLLYLEKSRPRLHSTLYGLPLREGMRTLMDGDAWAVPLEGGSDDGPAVCDAVSTWMAHRGWTAAGGQGNARRWTRHGATLSMELNWDEQEEVWRGSMRTTRPRSVTAAADLSDVPGQPISIRGVLRRRGDETWLELDGGAVRIEGDPWTAAWARRVDGPVGVECTVARDALTACGIPFEG